MTNVDSESRNILRDNKVSDRDSAAVRKRVTKPTQTSAEDTACLSGLKRFNTKPQAGVAIKIALRKRDVEETQMSTDRLKRLNMAKITYMLETGIDETAEAIVTTQPARILQLME